MQGLANRSADFRRLEGGHDKTSHLSHRALLHSGSSDGQGCKKGRLDGCLLPISFPVTVGLGENATGALNALVPVPAAGGGRHDCARGSSIRTSQFPYLTVIVQSSPQSIRMTLFPYSRLWTSSCPVNSTRDQGGVESGASIYARVLSSCVSVRVPLSDTLDNKVPTRTQRFFNIPFGKINA